MEFNYCPVTNIDQATHWISHEKNDYVSLNKIYQLHLIYDTFSNQDEYYIKNDKGQYSMDYLRFKGEYIKKIN